jgi:hypothetical protein
MGDYTNEPILLAQGFEDLGDRFERFAIERAKAFI